MCLCGGSMVFGVVHCYWNAFVLVVIFILKFIFVAWNLFCQLLSNCFISFKLVCFFFLSRQFHSRCCDSFSNHDNTVLSNNKTRCVVVVFLGSVTCSNIRIQINQFSGDRIAFAQSSSHFRFFH